MKLRIFHNKKGDIVSVVALERKALQPSSPDHPFIEVDLKDTKAKTLAEVHSGFHVDASGKLQTRGKSTRGQQRNEDNEVAPEMGNGPEPEPRQQFRTGKRRLRLRRNC